MTRPTASRRLRVETLEARMALSAIALAPMTLHDAVYPPQLLATGDFNNDRLADLAVAGPFPYPTIAPAEDEVRILLGDGAGGFSPVKATYPAGFSISALAVGDFDGDGNLDLVAANNTDAGTVHVLYGDGDAGFQPAKQFYVGSQPNDVAVGDLNGDRLLDIVTANAAPWSGEFTDEAPTPGAAVLYGQAAGGFRTAQKIRTDAPVHFVRVGLFNADRRLDVALAGPPAPSPGMSAVFRDFTQVFVAVGMPSGGFRIRPVTHVMGRVVSLDAGDIDHQGRLDLVAAVATGPQGSGAASSVVVLKNRGNGVFRAPVTLATSQPTLTDVALADLDGDHWLEIATVGYNPLVAAPFDVGSVTVYRNRRGRFGAPVDFTTIPYHALRLAVGRFSGHRLPDIAVSIPSAKSVGLFVNA